MKCPCCGSKLVTKYSIYGEFIGCSTFPACKYKVKVKTPTKGPLPGQTFDLFKDWKMIFDEK